MARSPRICIFCGANANSKEHLWPTWLHDLLGQPVAGERHNKELHTYHPREGRTKSGPTGRQGDQRTIRIRAVCMNCNSGWMNQLETKVRPFLTPIILGENVTLASEQIAILARWIALKVMVAEHDIPDVALTPLTDRIAFWREGEIPAYYRLYVAHNISGKNLYFRRHSHSVAKTSEGPIPPLDGTARNIQVVTMLAGKAVIQAVCARITDFTLENRSQVIGFHDRCRIWPDPPDTRDFPARPRLDLQGINFVATILERYLSVSKVTWID